MDIENEEDDLIAKGTDQVENQENEEEDFIIGEPAEPTEEEVKAAEIDNLPQIKAWRKDFKEKARRVKELEEEVALLKKPITNEHTPTVVEEPTLASCGYDTEEYKLSLKAWFDKKDQDERFRQDEERKAHEAQAQWERLTSTYNEQKVKLNLKDYKDAEDDFCSVIHPQKQADFLKYVKEPVKLIHALKKDSAKLKTLQDIDNPIDFVLKVKEYEAEMKSIKRSTSGAPPPESRIQTGGGSVVRNDARLKQLEDEADRTGDRTALVAYRRSLK